ncbi:MAG: GNAT family N-acetyltransferase [Candidatus Methylomirabilales bacterium]
MCADLGPRTSDLGLLHSDRLTLRPLRLEDAPEFVRLLGEDYEAVSMMSHMPWPCTEQAAQGWILMGFHSGARVFAILQREDGCFVGAVGFGGSPVRPAVGYWVGRPYWSRGYATEALRLVLDYARAGGAKSVEAETFPENKASERVLKKCGFRRTGKARRDCPARGGVKDVVVWGLDF